MKVLIIGLGSIAKKHITALKQIEPQVEIYAFRSNENAASFESVINIYSLQNLKTEFKFCIISNPTQLHFDTIKDSLHLNIPIFIEKPSLMSLNGSEQISQLISEKNIFTYVGFNLRFHPIIQFLKETISTQDVTEANIYCGSYLPDWRPDQDYTKVYSAHKSLGGGVHLDLIHEIDYATWLFGPPINSLSIKNKVSNLKIDSYDFAAYHLQYDNKMVNIQLNYYRKHPRRTIELITTNGVILADLLNQKIVNEKNEVLFSSNATIIDTYYLQMQYFINAISNKQTSLNSFDDSLANLKICLE